MLRGIIAAAALAAIAMPAAAQEDNGRSRYSIDAQEGWLGMGLECSRCTLTTSEIGAPGAWTFSAPPRVFSVDADGPADRAGLRIGDTLVAIDGVALVTARGGRAFGGIRPRQAVRLTYHREGREQTVRLVAGARPASREMMEVSRALRRAQQQQERSLASSREQLERSGRALDELRAELDAQSRQAQGDRDSSTLAQLERMRDALARQQQALQETLAERAALEARGRAETEPLAEPPEPPVAAQPPMPAEPSMPPSPPMSYREHRGFGPLRYTGRLGDVVIEARGPGSVTATEVSDSEVVVTSGDLSVRLALRPVAPTARPPRPPRE